MKGFVLKDLFLLRSILRSYIPMIVIYAFISTFSSSASILITALCLITILVPTTTFTYDEAAKWDTLALTMPVRRSQVVGAKYLVALLAAVGGTAATAAVMFAVSLLPSVRWAFAEQLPALPAGVAAALVVVSILLPLLFKYGIAKARIMLVVVMAAIAASTALFAFSNPFIPAFFASVLIFLGAHPVPGIAAAAAFVLLVMYGSYRISCRIYQSKEF